MGEDFPYRVKPGRLRRRLARRAGPVLAALRAAGPPARTADPWLDRREIPRETTDWRSGRRAPAMPAHLPSHRRLVVEHSR
jgi:hypothetical protein